MATASHPRPRQAIHPPPGVMVQSPEAEQQQRWGEWDTWDPGLERWLHPCRQLSPEESELIPWGSRNQAHVFRLDVCFRGWGQEVGRTVIGTDPGSIWEGQLDPMRASSRAGTGQALTKKHQQELKGED